MPHLKTFKKAWKFTFAFHRHKQLQSHLSYMDHLGRAQLVQYSSFLACKHLRIRHSHHKIPNVLFNGDERISNLLQLSDKMILSSRSDFSEHLLSKSSQVIE